MFLPTSQAVRLLPQLGLVATLRPTCSTKVASLQPMQATRCRRATLASTLAWGTRVDSAAPTDTHSKSSRSTRASFSWVQQLWTILTKGQYNLTRSRPRQRQPQTTRIQIRPRQLWANKAPNPRSTKGRLPPSIPRHYRSTKQV